MPLNPARPKGWTNRERKFCRRRKWLPQVSVTFSIKTYKQPQPDTQQSSIPILSNPQPYQKNDTKKIKTLPVLVIDIIRYEVHQYTI